MAGKRNLQGQFEAEQADFVELTRSLSDEQWSSPSLCEEWSVRDVVIHTAYHVHLPAVPVAAFVGVKRLGENFYPSLIAEHSDDSSGSLVEWLASPARCSKPNYCELLIHQQDVRRPLGMVRAIPPDHLSWFLDWCLTRFGSSQTGGDPRTRAHGVHLVATDLDWSAGEGPEVQGPSESILMAITGRAVALDELSGPGVEVLRQRAAG